MEQPRIEASEPVTTPLSASFETGHSDLIHDVQMDYFGKLIATASSDSVIKIFEVNNNNQQTHIVDLKGHAGPIWRVSWANPKYGTMLASCGYDKKIIIWKCNNKQWVQAFIDEDYKSSVNCIQFAPVDCGCIVAAGCADGTITVYQMQMNQKWDKIETFKAHNGGVNSISWRHIANTISIGSDNNNNKPPENFRPQRFVSGGCDNNVCIWSYDNNNNKYVLEKTLAKHNDWVSEVAWAPMQSFASHSIIASGSEDKTVIIWKERNKKWNESQQIKFSNKVWSVSWSELGNILAIASGDNQITLFKENPDGKWHDVTKINSSEPK